MENGAIAALGDIYLIFPFPCFLPVGGARERLTLISISMALAQGEAFALVLFIPQRTQGIQMVASGPFASKAYLSQQVV